MFFQKAVQSVDCAAFLLRKNMAIGFAMYYKNVFALLLSVSCKGIKENSLITEDKPKTSMDLALDKN